MAAPGVLVGDTDADAGTTLSAVKDTDPAHGSLTLGADGSFTYTPAAGYYGPDSFTYHASDGGLDSNVATVSITITDFNDPPATVADSATTDEDVQLAVAAPGVLGNDSDPEGLALTASLSAGPAHGTLDLAADGGYTYTPAANYNGVDSFTYRAFDGAVYSAVTTVSLTVTSVPDAPVAVADSYSTNEDTALSVAAPGVLANDSDGDATTPTAVKDSDPAHGSLTLSANGSFTYTPAGGYSGPDSFTYHASDGSLTSSTVTVSISVVAVNDPPVTVVDSATTTEDTALTVSAPGVLGNDSDPEGAGLTAVLGTGPAHGTLNLAANGGYLYTPAANYNGADSFTYRASDGGVQSALTTVSLTVSPVSDAPVAVADTTTANEDTALIVAAPGLKANDADVDSSAAQVIASLVAQALHGTAVVNANGSYSYTPAANYHGADSFTYHLTDETALVSATVAVSVTVTSVNDVPAVVGDAYATNEDVALVVPATGVLGNDTDADSDPLAAAVVAGPTKGTLAMATSGGFTYTPNANANGSDSFTYRATDGHGGTSASATVSLTVGAVNDPPTFTLGADPTVAEDSGLKTVTGFLTGVSPGPADEAGQTTSLPPDGRRQPAPLRRISRRSTASGTLTFRPASVPERLFAGHGDGQRTTAARRTVATTVGSRPSSSPSTGTNDPVDRQQ